MSDITQLSVFMTMGTLAPGLMSMMGINLIMNMFAKSRRTRFER